MNDVIRNKGGHPRGRRAPDLERSLSLPNEMLPKELSPDTEGQAFLERIWFSLTRTQRKWLIARTQAGSDQEASEAIGIHRHSHVNWRNEALFQTAYAIIRDVPIQLARTYLNSLAPKVVATLDEGLDGGEGTEMKDRLKAAELALRASGMMVSKLVITKKSLSYEEKLIRHRLENGLEVPEHLLTEQLKGEEN